MNDPTSMEAFERFKDFGVQKNFKSAVKSAFGAPLKAVKGIGNIEQSLTQFREDILRVAVYLHNLKKLNSGEKIRHWAGDVAEINEIAKTDKRRAAAKHSRETLGDYGDFTPFENDVLRNRWIFFYSWMRNNAKFWPTALKNAAKEGSAGQSIGAAARLGSINIATWLVRILGLYAVGWMWNHRDDEAEKKEKSLAPWLRAMPHVNIGDRTLWAQTALSDFAEWFAYQELSGIGYRLDAGFISRKEKFITRIITSGYEQKSTGGVSKSCAKY